MHSLYFECSEMCTTQIEIGFLISGNSLSLQQLLNMNLTLEAFWIRVGGDLIISIQGISNLLHLIILITLALMM